MSETKEWQRPSDDLRDDCWHVAWVSISDDECQCMDCLHIRKKESGFKSDWPQHDRGASS